MKRYNNSRAQPAYQATRYGTKYEDNNLDENIITVLYFNYKTYTNNVFKVKTLGSGAKKLLKKMIHLIPPSDGNFERVSKIYGGFV